MGVRPRLMTELHQGQESQSRQQVETPVSIPVSLRELFGLCASVDAGPPTVPGLVLPTSYRTTSFYRTRDDTATADIVPEHALQLVTP